MLASHKRHRASKFIGLFEDLKLLFKDPAPAALNTGGPFHLGRSYSTHFILLIANCKLIVDSLRIMNGTVCKGG